MVPAIRALSFDLPPGKILGLVGESGAGKSMVGRAIAQLLPAGFAVTSGALLFEGEDLVRIGAGARRALLGRAIAFIPQAPMTSLNPVRTIGAQFDEHLARLGEASRGVRRDRAVAMLTAARLPRAAELLTQYPHQLSGGMCQRVLIALAFSSNPRLVIADEPTTALDVTMHPPILALIADMQRQYGTAVIFITHDLRLAAQLCDQVMVMYAGRAVESGPARAVLSTPAHPYTRCLQLANPSLRAERRALYVMPDQMPSLRQLKNLSGCHFAPRCPLVTEDCRHASRRTLPSPPIIMSRAFAPRRRGPSRRRPAIALRRRFRAAVAASRSFAKALHAWRRIVRRRAQCCRGEAGDIQHRRERIRRPGRRKRQRQEHHCQNAGRAGAADGRKNPAQWR